MINFLRCLLAMALAVLPLAEAYAGSSTITTKDASGVTKTFFVTTDGSGNFYAAGVICDQSAAASCASVGTAGSPSTNALTVQAVTLGHGTAANAMRVELPTDGTGLVNAAQSGTWNVGTVSTVTNLSQMNGAALLMGNGVTGTGSQRVTIASDNTAFSINAVQSGTWNTATITTLTGGGVASGSADSGNPLKIGGKYNAAPITLTDGNRGDFQLDVNGYAKVNVTNANSNGQGTTLTSSPVVIASDQVAVAVKAASGTFASGAFASGSHASGSISSGALASGAFASGAVSSGAYASGSLASGAVVDITNVSTPITPATATATKGILLGGQYNSTIPTFTNGQQGSLQIASNGALRNIQTNPYPDTSVPYTATNTGTTAAVAATLTGAASVTTYLCGFSIRANATAAATGNATVTGTITGTLNFTQWVAPAASGLGIAEMIFTPCVPASAANTSIVVNSIAAGTAGITSVTAWGYKL